MEKVKLVFLDRDGVLNKYPGDFKYVRSVKEFRLLPKVKPALEKLCLAGFKLFIISNQAGVAKGLYTAEDLKEMDKRLIEKVGDKVKFSGILYCVHLSDENCLCRKPRIGLIDKVFIEFNNQGKNVNRQNSYFVGDSMIDIETGQAAGLKTILVFSGREKAQNYLRWSRLPDYKAADLFAAAQIIISS